MADGAENPSMARVIAIIPARLASSRFPRKVLADRTGRTLLQHVYESASRARLPDRVVVATDAEEVARVAAQFGAECVMTRVDHTSGTSRLGEAASRLGLEGHDIVINVQGDEPEIDPEVIDDLARAMLESGADCATVASAYPSDADPSDPNIVKVVVDASGHAMYFSRSPIPFQRDPAEPDPQPLLRHIGIYAYTRRTLEAYTGLAETRLERTEKLEQLRLLASGYRMLVIERETDHHGIDTPEQYEAFVRRWAGSNPPPA